MAEIILLGIGIGLIIAEMFLGSFFLLFIGFGFVVSAFLEWGLGFENYGNAYVLWALSVGVFSALSLVILRKPLKRYFKSQGYDDFLSHAEGVGVIKEGMVYFQGTLWSYEIEANSQTNTQSHCLESNVLEHGISESNSLESSLANGVQVRVLRIVNGKAMIAPL